MRVYRIPSCMGPGRVARESHRYGSATAGRTHAHDAASLAGAGSASSGGMPWDTRRVNPMRLFCSSRRVGSLRVFRRLPA
jgi:hypothetical protein